MNSNTPITITAADYERIDAMLTTLHEDAPDWAKALRSELDRAEIVESNEIPESVVTMNSTVRFVIGSSGRETEMTLVYPDAEDLGAGKMSVFAPVGSALLGLSRGDSIDWPRPAGGTMTLRVVDLPYQPERDGPRQTQ